jgi:transcriptional regulator with XRE-family HTH domain
MDDITTVIGTNLKNLRKERQLSLESLSQLTGVSISTLGEIERGVTNPTITNLWKIADGLKISLTELIREDSPSISIVYHGGADVNVDGDGLKIYSLYKFDPRKKFEIYYKVFEPGASTEASAHRKGMEEYILICEGTMALQVGEKEYTLSKGDAIRIDGHINHSYRNPESVQVCAYVILYYGNE